MLSRQDNEVMCRVGRDTAMGKAMRRFWLPALLASELKSDADPVHVELLGDNLVAFRDTNGRVGVLDEMCCHRGASLTIGRVENCGIRCIYHGWLFAADGAVLETPNVQDDRFKSRIRANAYPVQERGGVIWVYLGERTQMPDLPAMAFLDAEPSKVLPTMTIFGCNYVQVLEGLLDSSHLSVLHQTALARAAKVSGLNFTQSTSHMQYDAAPRVECEETDFGLHYAAIRQVGGQEEIRVTAFASPFYIFNPNGDFVSAVVPMTDEKTAFFEIWCDGVTDYGEEPMRTKQRELVGLDEATMESFGMTRSTSTVRRGPVEATGGARTGLR